MGSLGSTTPCSSKTKSNNRKFSMQTRRQATWTSKHYLPMSPTTSLSSSTAVGSECGDQASGEEDDKRLTEAAIVTAVWMSLSRVKTTSLYKLLGRVVVCSRLQLISLGLSSTHGEQHAPLQSWYTLNIAMTAENQHMDNVANTCHFVAAKGLFRTCRCKMNHQTLTKEAK